MQVNPPKNPNPPANPNPSPDLTTLEKAAEANQTDNPTPAPSPTTAADSASTPSTDHFDAIQLGPVPGESDPAATDGAAGGTVEPVAAGTDATAVVLSRDDFFDLFRGAFQMPNVGLALKKVQPLKSLVIAKDDEAARMASDVMYDICEETPWLRGLIRPEAKWLQRGMVLSAFGNQVWSNVSAELAARKATMRDPNDVSGGAADPDPGFTDAPDGAADRPKVEPLRKTDAGSFHEIYTDGNQEAA